MLKFYVLLGDIILWCSHDPKMFILLSCTMVHTWRIVDFISWEAFNNVWVLFKALIVLSAFVDDTL